MKHVKRLVVGLIALTLSTVIYTYVPLDWIKVAGVVVFLLGVAYLTGAAILR